MPLSTHILFGLHPDSFNSFWKALGVLISLLSSKETTHIFLLKILLKHNKKEIISLSLLIKYEYTFRFSNFVIIRNSFCNSSANRHVAKFEGR